MLQIFLQNDYNTDTLLFAISPYLRLRLEALGILDWAGRNNSTLVAYC